MLAPRRKERALGSSRFACWAGQGRVLCCLVCNSRMCNPRCLCLDDEHSRPKASRRGYITQCCKEKRNARAVCGGVGWR